GGRAGGRAATGVAEPTAADGSACLVGTTDFMACHRSRTGAARWPWLPEETPGGLAAAARARIPSGTKADALASASQAERESSAALGSRVGVNRGQASWPPTSAAAVGSTVVAVGEGGTVGKPKGRGLALDIPRHIRNRWFGSNLQDGPVSVAQTRRRWAGHDQF